MVKIVDDSVFNIDSDLLVNAINCQGIMAAGIALEYSLRYPTMFEQYKIDALNNNIKVGNVYIYESNNQKILNFPTKIKAKDKSDIQYIIEGLDYFVRIYKEYRIKSVAFPLLGCGFGDLSVNDVLPIMKEKLSNLELDVFICLNTAPASGLDKLMTDNFLKFNIIELFNILKIDFDPMLLIKKQREVKHLYEIASSKYVGTEANYRKIWCYIYEGFIKENDYEI